MDVKTCKFGDILAYRLDERGTIGSASMRIMFIAPSGRFTDAFSSLNLSGFSGAGQVNGQVIGYRSAIAWVLIERPPE